MCIYRICVAPCIFYNGTEKWMNHHWCLQLLGTFLHIFWCLQIRIHISVSHSNHCMLCDFRIMAYSRHTNGNDNSLSPSANFCAKKMRIMEQYRLTLSGVINVRFFCFATFFNVSLHELWWLLQVNHKGKNWCFKTCWNYL